MRCITIVLRCSHREIRDCVSTTPNAIWYSHFRYPELAPPVPSQIRLESGHDKHVVSYASVISFLLCPWFYFLLICLGTRVPMYSTASTFIPIPWNAQALSNEDVPLMVMGGSGTGISNSDSEFFPHTLLAAALALTIWCQQAPLTLNIASPAWLLPYSY